MSYIERGFALGIEIASAVAGFAVAIFVIFVVLAIIMTLIGIVGDAKDEVEDDDN